jgi:3-methyladenine DNA glycosylase AlkD
MWWDLCDPIAINLVGMLTRNTSSSGSGDGCKNNEYNSLTRLKPKILEWIQDEDNMWIRRTAILCQLKSKTSTDPELLFDLCRRRMDEKEFFIQKAIGWSLREYAKTDPSAVIAFLQDEKKSLSRLSYREGSRILISKGLMTD